MCSVIESEHFIALQVDAVLIDIVAGQVKPDYFFSDFINDLKVVIVDHEVTDELKIPWSVRIGRQALYETPFPGEYDQAFIIRGFDLVENIHPVIVRNDFVDVIQAAVIG